MKEIKRKVILQLDGDGLYWLIIPNAAICLSNIKGYISRNIFLDWAKEGFKKQKPIDF